MIDSVKESMLDDLKEEGKQELHSQLINRHGITNEAFWKKWQEEHKATDDQMILVALNELYDFEDVTEETELLGKTYKEWEWNEQAYKTLQYDLEDFAEKKAEEACQQGIRHMEIEVEL